MTSSSQRRLESADALRPISCIVREADGTRIEGTFISVHNYSVVVAVPSSTAGIPLGKQVRIEFIDSDARVVAGADARLVVRQKETAHSRQLGFVAVQLKLFEAEVIPAIERFFNRRQSFRVKIDAEDEVQITLVVGDVPESVRPVDLSDSNISVDAPIAFEEKLALQTRWRIQLLLPTEAQRIELGARIVRRVLTGGMAHYGIQFDAESKSFAQQQARIGGFVMAKQRELLRRSHHGRRRATPAAPNAA